MNTEEHKETVAEEERTPDSHSRQQQIVCSPVSRFNIPLPEYLRSNIPLNAGYGHQDRYTIRYGAVIERSHPDISPDPIFGAVIPAVLHSAGRSIKSRMSW